MEGRNPVEDLVFSYFNFSLSFFFFFFLKCCFQVGVFCICVYMGMYHLMRFVFLVAL